MKLRQVYHQLKIFGIDYIHNKYAERGLLKDLYSFSEVISFKDFDDGKFYQPPIISTRTGEKIGGVRVDKCYPGFRGDSQSLQCVPERDRSGPEPRSSIKAPNPSLQVEVDSPVLLNDSPISPEKEETPQEFLPIVGWDVINTPQKRKELSDKVLSTDSESEQKKVLLSLLGENVGEADKYIAARTQEINSPHQRSVKIKNDFAFQGKKLNWYKHDTGENLSREHLNIIENYWGSQKSFPPDIYLLTRDKFVVDRDEDSLFYRGILDSDGEVKYRDSQDVLKKDEEFSPCSDDSDNKKCKTLVDQKKNGKNLAESILDIDKKSIDKFFKKFSGSKLLRAENRYENIMSSETTPERREIMLDKMMKSLNTFGSKKLDEENKKIVNKVTREAIEEILNFNKNITQGVDDATFVKEFNKLTEIFSYQIKKNREGGITGILIRHPKLYESKGQSSIPPGAYKRKTGISFTKEPTENYSAQERINSSVVLMKTIQNIVSRINTINDPESKDKALSRLNRFSRSNFNNLDVKRSSGLVVAGAPAKKILNRNELTRLGGYNPNLSILAVTVEENKKRDAIKTVLDKTGVLNKTAPLLAEAVPGRKKQIAEIISNFHDKIENLDEKDNFNDEVNSAWEKLFRDLDDEGFASSFPDLSELYVASMQIASGSSYVYIPKDTAMASLDFFSDSSGGLFTENVSVKYGAGFKGMATAVTQMNKGVNKRNKDSRPYGDDYVRIKSALQAEAKTYLMTLKTQTPDSFIGNLNQRLNGRSYPTIDEIHQKLTEKKTVLQGEEESLGGFHYSRISNKTKKDMARLLKNLKENPQNSIIYQVLNNSVRSDGSLPLPPECFTSLLYLVATFDNLEKNNIINMQKNVQFDGHSLSISDPVPMTVGNMVVEYRWDSLKSLGYGFKAPKTV